MSPYEAYKLAFALKMHFTNESYDFFKYNGKVKHLETLGAQEKFQRNKQRYFYAQLAKHDDPQGLIVANSLFEPKVFVTELLDSKADERWSEWKARNEALSYTFEQDMTANDNWQRIMKMEASGIPFLLNKFIGRQISPETVVIIDAFSKKLDEWAKIDHPLVSQVQLRLRKYRPFVKFNKDRCKSILLKLADSK